MWEYGSEGLVSLLAWPMLPSTSSSLGGTEWALPLPEGHSLNPEKHRGAIRATGLASRGTFAS